MGELPILPNELAFQIFDDLDNADLFALAKSCRRLNVVATLYYLARHHIPNPDVVIDLDIQSFHVLPFLRISVQFTSSDNLLIILSASPSLDDIRGLECLILKLSFVRTVRISLDGVGVWHEQEDGAHVIEAIHSLLTSIISRSCTSLVISCPYTSRIYRPTKQKARRSRLSGLFSFILPWARISPKTPSIVDVPESPFPDTPYISALAEFKIDVPMLSDHSFLCWAIQLINASPITSLTFENPSSKPFFWDGLLPAIHCPTLSEFGLTDRGPLSFSSVSTFLARHPTIASLECKGLLRRDDEHQIASLPQLTRLISSYESVVYILEDTVAFPSLRNISLDSFSHAHPSPFNPFTLGDALECVRRCPNEVELSLMFDRDVKPLTAWLDVDVYEDGRVERSLNQLVGLTLVGGTLFATNSLCLLPKWLALFPALRFLTFRFCLPNEWLPQLPFVRSVIGACSQLERLTVNRETHTVDNWLAMKD